MKQYYLKDQEGNYYYEADYSYLVGPVSKEKAETMSETTAKHIIEQNEHLEMEEA